MKRTACRSNVPIGLLATLAFSATVFGQTRPVPTSSLGGVFVVVDAPHAGKGPGDPSCFGLITCPGSVGKRINAAGEMVGFSLDDKGVYHGFVRSAFGSIAAFDAPGAGSMPGSFQGTLAYSVNLEGVVTGFFVGADNVAHGFVGRPDGELRTFDAPGAGAAPGEGTWALAINDAGEVGGYVADAGNVYHGFVRDPFGKVTTFDAPRAGTMAFQGTVVADNGAGLDETGTAVGWYYDDSQVVHGFVRSRGGHMARIDFPDAGVCSAYAGSYVSTRNSFGELVGISIDDGYVDHGALREGLELIFEAPGAGPFGGQGTAEIAINDAGYSTGYVVNEANVARCFLRDPWCHIDVFDPPGAGMLAFQGSEPQGINFWGAIVGYFTDENWVNHAFIRYP